MPSNANVCKNCTSPLQGVYCHSCGEKSLQPGDKSLKHFFEETFAALFVADGKFPLSLKYLLTRPAYLPEKYISGVRKKYLSPVQLFFLANLVYFLIPMYNTFTTTLDIQQNALPYSEWIKPVVQDHLVEAGMSYEQYEVRFNTRSTSNSKLMLIVMVILFGLVFQLLFMGSKNYFLVDFFTAAAYLMSFYLLFVLVILPIIVILLSALLTFDRDLILQHDMVVTMGVLIILFSYSFFLIRGTFKTTTRGSLWRSFIFMGLIIPCMFIYRFLLFWITYWTV
jgi:hypothetical protein